MANSLTQPVPAPRRMTMPIYTTNNKSYRNTAGVFVDGNLNLPVPKEGALTAKALTRASPTLVSVNPPRMAMPTEPMKENLRRYYVYVATVPRIGSFPVVTEGGVRVAYMNSTQAQHFIEQYMIGAIPFLSLTSTQRDHINAFFKQS